MRDEGIERSRVAQRAPHHAAVADLLIAIGEQDRARVREQADLGHHLTFEGMRQRGGGKDVHAGARGAAPEDEVDEALIVDHRRRVRHLHERGDAARRRRTARRFERLLMLGARLADDDTHVDEAGHEREAVAFDDVGVARLDARADVENGFGEQDCARPIVAARWIDDADIAEERWAGHAQLQPFSPVRGRRWSRSDRMRGRAPECGAASTKRFILSRSPHPTRRARRPLPLAGER
ncbi:MAG: hypothetical protein WDM79_09105 [Terricaulis sp.]